MTRKMVWETRQIFNGYQPTNLLEIEGPVTFEDEEGGVRWTPERLFCCATWTDGRTIYSIDRCEDGRFTWSVAEFAKDSEDDCFRENKGVEDTYEKAFSHLSAFLTDPDHIEVVDFFVYEEIVPEDFEDIPS